jgi:hypothetical protein
MAVEARRGCGYRKVGGLYLVGKRLGVACCKMPIALRVCPTCNGGIKQARGWQWIDPRPWLKGECKTGMAGVCAAATPDRMGERAGLLWIGTQFYPTAETFALESDRLGISRRITAVPRGFKAGETYVFLAHPRLIQETDDATGESTWVGGVFRIFRPDGVEKIVTETQARDADAMAKLRKAGITPVAVPDDDPDHRGSVYDDDNEDALPLGIDKQPPEVRP